MQGAMAVAWAHQDCSRPLDLTEQWAEKIRQLRGQLIESEKKLAAREEELKNNAIDLVARTEGLERAQAEIGLLKEELARLHAENWSLKDQVEEAKVAATNVVSEYQSSAEMVALNKEAAEAFAYTTMTRHPDWDLAYLGVYLADQIAEWRAELQANQPPAEERPARPSSPAAEPLSVPHPPPEVHPEQVIEGDQEPVVRVAESDESIKQIDNPNGILDRLE